MSALQNIVQHARETTLLQTINAAIEWDERTYLPAAAGPYRAEQLTYLAGLIHQRQTDPRLGDWLEEAEREIGDDDPHSDRSTTIRMLGRDYEKRTKLPRQLVEALAKNSVEGQQAWVEARKEKSFSTLRPFLDRMVELKREQARATGFAECMYDALLDDYEPEEKTSCVRAVFASLRDELVPLLQSVLDSGYQVPVDMLHRQFPIAAQKEMGRLAAARIGFDFQRGRLDVTDHPFCTEFGPHDCRITTRYDERFFPSALFGTLHEAGHGIYEQGLRGEHYGLPPGRFVSMSIHESQSRLWENLVGRSHAFWIYFFPVAQQLFPAALGNVDVAAFLQAINEVKPSLIRVEADEVTYNLHVIIRFELEQELIEGTLPVADLPAAWNARYEELLGITPPDDGDGVLQDIHWSAGYVGYFPTYALGNLYAAQFLEQARRDLGDLEGQMQRGEFEPLRTWLATNIHQCGQCYSPAELVLKVTGKPLTQTPLISHLKQKLSDVYKI